jgi:hypothetical protein
MWWVDDHHVPTWREASQRLELLWEKGACPEAFDFQNPFDPKGEVYKCDQGVEQL